MKEGWKVWSCFSSNERRVAGWTRHGNFQTSQRCCEATCSMRLLNHMIHNGFGINETEAMEHWIGIFRILTSSKVVWIIVRNSINIVEFFLEQRGGTDYSLRALLALWILNTYAPWCRQDCTLSTHKCCGWQDCLYVTSLKWRGVWAERFRTCPVIFCLGSNLTSAPLFFHSSSPTGACAASVRDQRARWFWEESEIQVT